MLKKSKTFMSLLTQESAKRHFQCAYAISAYAEVIVFIR